MVAGVAALNRGLVKMRWYFRTLVFFIMTCACGAQNVPTVEDTQQVQASLQPLFMAMKNGDVQTMEKYFAGQMYAQYKVLLEENSEYPQFLRDFYRDAKFSVGNVTKTPDGG